MGAPREMSFEAGPVAGQQRALEILRTRERAHFSVTRPCTTDCCSTSISTVHGAPAPGASRQAGWTVLVAEVRVLDPHFYGD
jgi:hypothetical protein